jgi:hypothetical protein
MPKKEYAKIIWLKSKKLLVKPYWSGLNQSDLVKNKLLKNPIANPIKIINVEIMLCRLI